MDWKYYLEYSSANAPRADEALYVLLDDDEYEIEYEAGTLIVYTNMDPMVLEQGIYEESGAYAENYGEY